MLNSPERLCLNKAGINDEDMSLISRWLVNRGALATVKTLSIAANFIGDAGVGALAESSGDLTALCSLSLFGNQYGHAGIQTLAVAIRDGHLESLETLYVDAGPLGTRHPELSSACQKKGVRLL